MTNVVGLKERLNKPISEMTMEEAKAELKVVQHNIKVIENRIKQIDAEEKAEKIQKKISGKKPVSKPSKK